MSADPDFGLAHAYAAMLTALGADTGLILARSDVERRVLDSAARAVALGEGSATILWNMRAAPEAISFDAPLKSTPNTPRPMQSSAHRW